MIANILVWALFGLIAGALAQFIMPGKQSKGIVVTSLLGIVGALVGGFVSSQLLGWDVTGFNLPSLAIAVGGALLLLIVYRFVASTTK